MNRIFGIILIVACIFGLFWLQNRIESGQLSPFNIIRAQKGQLMMGLGILTGLYLAIKNVKYKEKDPFKELEDY